MNSYAKEYQQQFFDSSINQSRPNKTLDQAIGLLRQWLNEERIHYDKMVTNEELHHWLDDVMNCSKDIESESINLFPAEAELRDQISRIKLGELANGSAAYLEPREIEIIMNLFTQHHQALLQKIEEAMPKANPCVWVGNYPQMAWTIGFEKAVTEFTNILNQAREGKL